MRGAAISSLAERWSVGLGDYGVRVNVVCPGLVDAALITKPGQVTDCYLLALAASTGGKLETFDRRLATNAVRGGRAGVCVTDGGG